MLRSESSRSHARHLSLPHPQTMTVTNCLYRKSLLCYWFPSFPVEALEPLNQNGLSLSFDLLPRVP